MSDQVSVQDAALAVKRSPSRVYTWVREERLTVWEDAKGRIFVSLAEVQELETRMFKRINNRKTRRSAET